MKSKDWSLCFVLLVVGMVLMVGFFFPEKQLQRPGGVQKMAMTYLKDGGVLELESGGQKVKLNVWMGAMPMLVDEGHMLTMRSPRDLFETVKIFRMDSGWVVAVVDDNSDGGLLDMKTAKLIKMGLSAEQLQKELDNIVNEAANKGAK